MPLLRLESVLGLKSDSDARLPMLVLREAVRSRAVLVAEVIGEMQYENAYRLAYIRGP